MHDGDFRAIFYVRDIPDITFEDGHFHICYTTGHAHFEFVLRPNTYSKALRNAQRVFGEFNAGDVVGIKDEH